MNLKAIFLASALLIGGCATEPKRAPVCFGDSLQGCKPVVYFAEGSDVIPADQKETLEWAYNKLVRWPRKYIKVTGHTDSRGHPDENLRLSKNRAMAVKKFFISRGIDADRIVIDFKGESERVCVTSKCYDLNRRAEVEFFSKLSDWSASEWVPNALKD